MSRLRVLLTVTALPKSLATDLAQERLLSAVDAVVVLQSIRPEEALLARLALVPSLPAVDQPVLVEHGPGEEALATDQTLVRAFVRVKLADVVVQVRTNREASLASRDGALERLHALVKAQMLPQVTRLRVRLSAHVAQVLPILSERSSFRLLRVLLLKVVAVLGAVVENVAAHFAAQQKLPGQVGVAREEVVLLVPEEREGVSQ